MAKAPTNKRLKEREQAVKTAKEREEYLDSLAFQTFKTPAGKKFLDYLRQITVNTTTGPGMSDGELRHKAGRDYLFGLIYQRYERGSKNG